MYTTCVCNYEYTCTYTRGFDMFEAWAKLAQQWLVCTPLGIHLEPINKQLMLLVIN